MATVNVRYMVNDVEASIAFYTTHLGFTLISKTLPAFADVSRGERVPISRAHWLLATLRRLANLALFVRRVLNRVGHEGAVSGFPDSRSARTSSGIGTACRVV